MKTVKTSELQIGDTVRMVLGGADSPWTTCIVKQITDEAVTIFRPYGTTADFTYTGGVICYIGLEEYKVERSSAVKWVLYHRQELR